MSHNERILLDCLSDTIDSLEYVERVHPGLSGNGVRQTRIRKAKDIIAGVIITPKRIHSPTDLVMALTDPSSAPLITITSNGIDYTGYLCNVERESGGGKCFNVKLRMDGHVGTYFVRFS